MNTTCTELVVFMHSTGKSMNNLLSYCGLVDPRIDASDKNLPIPTAGSWKKNQASAPTNIGWNIANKTKKQPNSAIWWVENILWLQKNVEFIGGIWGDVQWFIPFLWMLNNHGNITTMGRMFVIRFGLWNDWLRLRFQVRVRLILSVFGHAFSF